MSLLNREIRNCHEEFNVVPTSKADNYVLVILDSDFTRARLSFMEHKDHVRLLMAACRGTQLEGLGKTL